MHKINSSFYIPSVIVILIALCHSILELTGSEVTYGLLLAWGLAGLLSDFVLLWILKNVLGIKKLYNAIMLYTIGGCVLIIRGALCQLIPDIKGDFAIFILAAHLIQYPLMYFIFVTFRTKDLLFKRELRILGILYLLEWWLPLFLHNEFGGLLALWALLPVFSMLCLMYLIRQVSLNSPSSLETANP